MFDTGGSETYWLNATNIALGLVTLICVVAIIGGVARELVARWTERRVTDDGHAILVPGVGLTMADGGEPVSQPKDEKQK
jgi:hypothetical protein